ncbi:MAG TPA: homoserine O-succinyltransferase [Xanthobacteraceae bacterium]|nr:homoserine O-succinyltransferase [Xanthobacteraceae bacterium]
MPLLLDIARSGSAAAVELHSTAGINIGLVNNMPAAAFAATERQFVELLHTATKNAVVCLKLFSIADVPRADPVCRDLAGRYRDLSELWDTRLDGLIVTGTEPRAASLKNEPYWAKLTELVDWGRENTASTIWSCLAAHAAVLHADGIERRVLADKQFGVFDCDVVAPHAMTRSLGPRLRVPHSRCNDLPAPALAACGYRLLTRTDAAAVDMFIKAQPRFLSLFVFLQGHPEYQAGTLLREYRRDVARFLSGEREHYPAAPQRYFNDAAAALAAAFRARVIGDRRGGRLADFPMGVLEAGLECTWRRSAIAIYENWLDYLKERKAEQRLPTIPSQRTRRGAWPRRMPA